MPAKRGHEGTIGEAPRRCQQQFPGKKCLPGRYFFHAGPLNLRVKGGRRTARPPFGEGGGAPAAFFPHYLILGVGFSFTDSFYRIWVSKATKRFGIAGQVCEDRGERPGLSAVEAVPRFGRTSWRSLFPAFPEAAFFAMATEVHSETMMTPPKKRGKRALDVRQWPRFPVAAEGGSGAPEWPLPSDPTERRPPRPPLKCPPGNREVCAASPPCRFRSSGRAPLLSFPFGGVLVWHPKSRTGCAAMSSQERKVRYTPDEKPGLLDRPRPGLPKHPPDHLRNRDHRQHRYENGQRGRDLPLLGHLRRDHHQRATTMIQASRSGASGPDTSCSWEARAPSSPSPSPPSKAGVRPCSPC